MPVLSKGFTFANNDQVTSTRLNDLVDAATFASDSVDNITTQLSSGKIVVKEINTGQITNSAVTTAKIADSAVTTAKITDGAITASKIATGLLAETVESVTNSIFVIGSGDAIPFDNTIPQNTEGEEVLTATITPSSNANKVLITCEVNCVNTTAGNSGAILALFKNSDANAIAARAETLVAEHRCVVFSYIDSPATTSATTYKLRCGYGGTFGYYINAFPNGTAIFGGVMQSSIRLTEIVN
jgi:hypothetical protein